MANNTLKTNKVIEWVVTDRTGYIAQHAETRKIARAWKNLLNITENAYAPFRIAKVVVTK